MSGKRNSITLRGQSAIVSSQYTGDGDPESFTGVVVKIHEPSNDDLVRTMNECCKVLEMRRRRGEIGN